MSKRDNFAPIARQINKERDEAHAAARLLVKAADNHRAAARHLRSLDWEQEAIKHDI